MLLIQDKPDGSAKNIVFGVAFGVTIVMAVYIWWKMRKIKKVLLEEQAERRKARFQPDGSGDEEGRGLLGGVGVRQGGREYEAVAQGEVDIGVVDMGHGHGLPQYREDLEYRGAAGSRHDGKEPVREQQWV